VIDTTGLQMTTMLPPTELIGRDQEFRRLHELWHLARNGQGQTVFITGEAGMGKSTLMEAFAARVAATSPGDGTTPQIATGGCSQQFGREEAYLPFAYALAALLERGKDDETTARKLFNIFYDSAPAWIQLVPVIGGVLGGIAETAKSIHEHIGGGSQEQVREPDQSQMLQQYTNTLFALAHAGPVMLLLDDLHWADSASVTLLAHLARRIKDQPVMIVGTYRYSDAAVDKHPLLVAARELERYRASTEIALSTFDLAGFEMKVAQTLQGHRLSRRFVNRLYEQTGGVPLFTVETLSYLQDSGIIRHMDGAWQLTQEVDEIELPTSVEAVIERRLERLDDERRRALQYASVEGTEFTSTVLALLVETDELEVEEQLEQVEKLHHLVRFQGEVELGREPTSLYQFSHALFQKVLYDSLRGKRLRLLHRRAGEALEGLHGEDTERVAHQLALHFELGNVPGKALRYSLQAAQRGLNHYAWDEAALGFERAQRLADQAIAPEMIRAQVHEGLGDIARARASYEEALDHYATALDELPEAQGEEGDEFRARLHRKRARTYEHLGDLAAAFTSLEQGLQHAPGESLEAAALNVMGAGLCERQGRYAEGIRWSNQALLEDCLPATHPLRAHANQVLGLILSHLGQSNDALNALHQALDIYQKLDDLPGQFDACSNLGSAYFARAKRGDWSRAQQLDERAYALAERMHDTERQARASANLGWTAYCLGNFSLAVEAYEYSLQVWNANSARLMCAIIYSNLGAVELARENYTVALSTLQKAKQELEEIGAQGELGETCRHLALAYASSGNLPEAYREAQQALVLARATRSLAEEGAAQRVLGQVALRAGVLGPAYRALSASRTALEQTENQFEIGKTLLALAELYSRRQEAEQVRTLLNEAIGIFSELGAQGELSRAQGLLNTIPPIGTVG
jgi:tetratricopeptide (TPR) repeat protein